MGEADRERFAAFVMRMRAQGLDNRDLIAAIEGTPRLSFVPAQWWQDAWSDRSLPIECGETIEGIDLQARAMALLDLQPGCRVLEIGTGSGFTSAVMSQLASRVLTVDRFKTLTRQATERHEALGLNNILVRQTDGSQGIPSEGPFDRIIAWAAYEALPRGFVDQLSSGGIMIAAIGPGDGVQALEKLTKLGSRFEREVIANVRFQPMVQGVAQAI